jgi:hypothetical protein
MAMNKKQAAWFKGIEQGMKTGTPSSSPTTLASSAKAATTRAAKAAGRNIGATLRADFEAKHPRKPAGTPEGGEFAPGSVVTREPSHSFDGRPVQGWPNPYYLGKVMKVEPSKYGGTYATVKWNSGRKSLENVVGLLSGAKKGK